MTDLRQAMLQAVDALGSDNPDVQLRAAVTLRAALAAPQPEPVAWMKTSWSPDSGEYTEFLRGNDELWRDRQEWTPLYTTPPQRQPLTIDECENAFVNLHCVGYAKTFTAGVRYAEKAHGIGVAEVNTTLNRIRDADPCADGWAKLLRGLGKTEADDEPLALTRILDINGLDNAIWALRCVDDQSQVRRYTVWCVRQVQHLMTDSRSLAALDVAERHANGQATDEELAAAKGAAWDAAWAAGATWATGAAAWAAKDAASDAAGAARDAARAARDAASAAAKAAQEAQFRIMFGGAT